MDEKFPREPFEDLGYNVERPRPEDLQRRRPALEIPGRGRPPRPARRRRADEHARYIEAVIGAPRPVRVGCLYLPNGNPIGTEKFAYKLALDGPAARPRRRPAGAGGAVRPVRRLQRHPRARGRRQARRAGSPTPCSSPRAAPPSARSRTSASPTPRRGGRRAAGYTFWDYQAGRLAAEPRHPHRPRPALAPGRRPAASASRSTATCATGRSPPTTCRWWSSWTCRRGDFEPGRESPYPAGP